MTQLLEAQFDIIYSSFLVTEEERINLKKRFYISSNLAKGS